MKDENIFDLIMEYREDLKDFFEKPLPEDCTVDQLKEIIAFTIIERTKAAIIEDIGKRFEAMTPRKGYDKGGVIHSGGEFLIRTKDLENWYCDKADYSGGERCKEQCEVCKGVHGNLIELAKGAGQIKDIKPKTS